MRAELDTCWSAGSVLIGLQNRWKPPPLLTAPDGSQRTPNATRSGTNTTTAALVGKCNLEQGREI